MVKINLKVDTDKKDMESTMISKNIVNNACYSLAVSHGPYLSKDSPDS